MKHLRNPRKRKQSDSAGSGERKRKSPNREDLSSRGSGTTSGKDVPPANPLENGARERDSRLTGRSLTRGIPSSALHVKLCVNLSGPPDKAKYSLTTDSELVPRGKGEKNPFEGSEIEPATTCLQCVGGPQGLTACLLHNESASYYLSQA